MSEIMQQGLVVCVVGLCTVFLVLIMLWVILEIMHVIVGASSKSKSAAETAVPETTTAAQQAPIQQPTLKLGKLAPLPEGDPKEDKQFVAAVMGAIAAHDGADSFDFKIKSIKKL